MPPGPAEVVERILILVLRHLANEFRPMFLQASNDVVDVRDSEHDPTDTMGLAEALGAIDFSPMSDCQ